ncbi:MAG: type I-C CRISPR-associated protein Cas8c/Csd1 [Marichromatium sp.]|nr:type I-C CRISPR-associated protein Cas8c/Csd1 [Marichromatium sp.]
MILQALHRHYQHLLERDTEGVAALGYSQEKVSYAIVLDPTGAVVAVDDIRDTSGKKPRPRLLEVPQPVKRTAGIKPNVLWDKTSYVLGVSASSKRAAQEHAAFVALHESALAGTEDPGLLALLRFLGAWTPERFVPPMFSDEVLDTNLVFRLDGERRYLHQREAARQVRADLLVEAGDDGEHVTCLVTGVPQPMARLHPPIKGVRGAQSSGAAIVSFNLDAFTSYGKEQGGNAPVSQAAAFGYTTALNHLLRPGEHNHQRLLIGDTTVVFWAETAAGAPAPEAELLFDLLLDPPSGDASPDEAQETQRVREVLEDVRRGRPLVGRDPGLAPDTRMFVLGLAPNASRLSVRFWQVDTLDVLTRRLAQHAEDLRLEPVPWRTAPGVRRLVLATVPHRDGAMPKMDDAFDNLVGELLRAILGGGRYPRSLLANTIMRIRADGHLSGLRVAICKAVLTREQRLGNPPRPAAARGSIHTSEEEIPVSLDTRSTQPGYLLGRLFALLEHIQRGALGTQVNATIRDRYYGAASATPASIFPVLLRNTQNHLAKLRKERTGLAVTLEQQLGAIVDGLPERFPRSLRIEDQGRFAIGYYHQTQAFYTKRAATDTAADETQPEGTDA